MEESDEAPEESQEWRSASGGAEEGQETAIKGSKEELNEGLKEGAKGSVADLTVDVTRVGCKPGTKLKVKPFVSAAKRLVELAAAAVVPLQGSEGVTVKGSNAGADETVSDVGATAPLDLGEGCHESVQKTDTGVTCTSGGWSSGVFELLLRHSSDGTGNLVDGPGGQVCLSLKFSGIGLVCALLVIYGAILAFR
jgi:hypothetical protein